MTKYLWLLVLLVLTACRAPTEDPVKACERISSTDCLVDNDFDGKWLGTYEHVAVSVGTAPAGVMFYVECASYTDEEAAVAAKNRVPAKLASYLKRNVVCATVPGYYSNDIARKWEDEK